MRLRLVLFVLPLLTLCAALHAAPPERAPEKLSPAFQKKIVEAITAYKLKDYAKAEKLANEANAIQPDTLAGLNLLGAIKLDQGQVDEAAKLFEKTLEKDPAFYPAKFNLAEIPFQAKEYDKAREMFEKLLAENPSDELAQFKIFLSYLLQKNMGKARKTLESIPWPGDTPAYYFAHAAWEYAHDNVKDAEGWIQSASRIFSPSANAIYAETLEELGWLKLKKGALTNPGLDIKPDTDIEGKIE